MLEAAQEQLHDLRRRTGLTAVAAGFHVPKGPWPLQSQVVVAGKRRADEPGDVAPMDCWHIGSVTKSMTATLLGVMQDAGELALTDNLGTLLPQLPMHHSWRQVTLLNLLTHSSGLAANFALRTRKRVPESAAELMQLRHELLADVLRKPGRAGSADRFRYSNLGYTLAGYCAEVLSQQPFQELLSQRLWQPLKMLSAGFGAPRGTQRQPPPLGHQRLLWGRFPQDPKQGQADNTPIIDPAGRAHMSVADLLRFGHAHLQGLTGQQASTATSPLASTPASKSICKPATWRQLHQPAIQNYACGWTVDDSPVGELHWHNGSNTLWYCLLIVAPAQQSVLAFATNEGAVRRAERAFFKLALSWLQQVSASA